MFTKRHTARKPVTDTWLTPPDFIRGLGRFDLDPCCPKKMPWRTAKKMVSLPVNGLDINWKGRVWCNPPYSNPMPWVEKMSVHRNGIMLLPAKSPETRWGQRALGLCDAVLFMKGRLLFHYEDGKKSKGKWMPTMLCAWGKKNVLTIGKVNGVLFKRRENGR